MLHDRSLLRANATRAAGLILACIGLTTCASQDTETEVVADVPDPWGLPAPPPKSVYNGPLFDLSHDYPAHATPHDPAPWRAAIGNGRITTANADAYVQALKDFIAADMKVLLFDYGNWDAGARGWYSQPWLSSTSLSNGTYTREPIHGTYVGSAGVPAGMFPKSGLKTSMDTHVLVYYDAVAATSLSRVWGTEREQPRAWPAGGRRAVCGGGDYRQTGLHNGGRQRLAADCRRLFVDDMGRQGRRDPGPGVADHRLPVSVRHHRQGHAVRAEDGLGVQHAGLLGFDARR